MGKGIQRYTFLATGLINLGGSNVQHGDYSLQHYIVYWKVAKRIVLKSSHDT